MRYGWLVCAIVLACSGGRAAPTAATELAKTFAPDVVGTIVPITPRAGDYAMALTMIYDSYPSMEMRITERRTGALRLTLAADGAARACLGSRGAQVVAGQYHYEPPERREHHSREDARLLALAGQWKIVDGVATIQFDHLSWATCELANAIKIDKPVAELRCVTVGPTDRVPAGSLACEASDQSQLLELGMSMTAASRNVPDSPIHPSASGRNLVLGAPGVIVDVAQDAGARTPTIRFHAGVVTLVEADYRTTK